MYSLVYFSLHKTLCVQFVHLRTNSWKLVSNTFWVKLAFAKRQQSRISYPIGLQTYLWKPYHVYACTCIVFFWEHWRFAIIVQVKDLENQRLYEVYSCGENKYFKVFNTLLGSSKKYFIASFTLALEHLKSSILD